MGKESRNDNKDVVDRRVGDGDDDGAQLILIAGLLVAIAVLAVATIIGGGFFSQSALDDDISSFSAQVGDRIGTAEQVSQENIEFVNENATLFEGRYPAELCGDMVDETALQQLIADELSEDEVILGMGVMEDCEEIVEEAEGYSWLVGQSQDDELPALNVSETEVVEGTEICGNEDEGLHSLTGYAEHTDEFIQGLIDTTSEDPAPENPTTQQLIDAFTENDDNLNDPRDVLPDGVTAEEYVDDCIDIEIVEGRAPVDVVFSIDTTGSMGLDPSTSTPIDENYNDFADHPTFSLASLEEQGHNERVDDYPDAVSPFEIECYKEYDETGVEFPGYTGDNRPYPDKQANRDWCEGENPDSDMNRISFSDGSGDVGDFVYYENNDEIVEVVDLDAPEPPQGVPEDWERLEDVGVSTDDQSEFCVDNNGDVQDCETRQSDPGSVSGVLEVDNSGLSTENVDTLPDEPITAEVTDFVESDRCVNEGWLWCNEEDDVWEVDDGTGTYEVREDALSIFEYRWNHNPDADVTVEDESGTEFGADSENLDYIEYRWWIPDRIFLTQAGARAAVDDLLDSDPDGEATDSIGLVEYSTGDPGNAREVRSLQDLDGDHASDLKQDIDELRPDAGTDITSGLIQAKSTLDADSDPDKTDHIVLMTDGFHNVGEPPACPEAGYYSGESGVPFNSCSQPGGGDGYIGNNEEEFEDTFIHAVALGSDADEEPMEILGNEDNEFSDVRPSGTFIASDDPADAEDIFTDIIGSIQDETEFENVTSETPDEDEEFTVDEVVNSGAVEDIEDTRLGVTDFVGNGTYELSFVDTDEDGDEETVWGMTVENNPNEDEYTVEFVSETHGTAALNETFTRSQNDLSHEDEYVWIDLTGKDDDRDRFEMGKDGYNETDYDVEEAWQEVQNELVGPGDGVAIVSGHIPNPDWEGGVEAQQADGVFSFDFTPLEGDFTKIGGIDGGAFEDACLSGEEDLPEKCGLDDEGNDAGAVSTAQITGTFEIIVTVEGPEGESTRTIEIDPRDRMDILEGE